MYEKHQAGFYPFYLFDIAEKRHSPHNPVPRPNITLEVNRPNIVQLGPGWLPVDWTFIQLAVLP